MSIAERPVPLPFVGREDLVERLLDRLERPDDLRNVPADFISPGFYGLAGSGKTRLLSEVAASARAMTPYVIEVNCDPRSTLAPRTPIALLERVIGLLEAQELEARGLWGRLTWRWSNPFAPIRQALARFTPVITQTITVVGGSASDVTQTASAEAAITSEIRQAFAKALARLKVQSDTQQLIGVIGRPKRCALILLTVDSVELAPPPLRRWLPELHSLAGGQNTLDFNFVCVAAGRFQQSGLLETYLPLLSGADTEALITAYARFKATGLPAALSRGFEEILDAKDAVRRIAELSAGNPLLLQLLVDAEARSAAAGSTDLNHVEVDDETRVRFVVTHYLDRIKQQAHEQDDEQLWQLYHLLLYATVPRIIPSASLLRDVLKAIPGTSFDERSNYDALVERLAHEGFVNRTDQGALIVHALVRDGVLGYLQANDPDLLAELHKRSARWFKTVRDSSNYFYHGIRAGDAAVASEMKAAIEHAIGARRLAEAHALLTLMADAPLSDVDARWVSLADMDLAFADGNLTSALSLAWDALAKSSAPGAWAEIVARFERWLSFHESIEARLEDGEEPDVPPGRRRELGRWAEVRGLRRTSAYALRLLGRDAFDRQDFAEARTLVALALRTSEEIHDERHAARCLEMIGEIALMAGPLGDAQSSLRAASARYGAAGLARDELRCQATHAIAEYYSGNPVEAIESLRRIAEHQERAGDTAARAASLRILGVAEALKAEQPSNDPEGGRRDSGFEKSLKLYQDLGDSGRQGLVWLMIGEYGFERCAGPQPNTFSIFARESLLNALARLPADGPGRAQALLLLGILASMGTYSSDVADYVGAEADIVARVREVVRRSEVDRVDAALYYLRNAARSYHQAGDGLSEAHAKVAVAVGSYLKHRGDVQTEAMRLLPDALQIYERHGDKLGQAAVLSVYGQIELWQHDHSKAVGSFGQALALLSGPDDPNGAAWRLKVGELIERARSEPWKPAGESFGIWFPLRCRAQDLFGWSPFLRRERFWQVLWHVVENTTATGALI